MKRTFLTLIATALLLGLAWLVPHSLFSITLETATQTPASLEDPTVVAPTAQILPTPDGKQESYENISFVIPTGLGSGASGEIVPANPEPLAYSTKFVRIVLNDFPVVAPSPNDYYKAEVRVYPVAEYIALNNWAYTVVNRLQTMLANPSAPLLNATLPYPPYRGTAAQLYAAQARLVSFKNGNGVRMLSSYAQYPAPIGKLESIYHYEGLTQDGKYFLVVDVPVVLPAYSDITNPGENGVTYPLNYQGWEDVQPYYQSMTDLLNTFSPDTFNPNLDKLDALVQSINVGEVSGLISTAPLETPCSTSTDGVKPLSNAENSYCLLYPAAYSTTIKDYIVINPTNLPGDMPGDSWVSIKMENAAGRSADQISFAKITEAGLGFNITRYVINIDNEQAIVVDGLPGQDSSRKVYVVHGDRLYTFSFEPWYPAPEGSAQLTPLEDLYAMLMQTFRFLP
jgi:hypothetical protein